MQVLVREMLLSEKADVEAFFSRSLGFIDRIGFLLLFEEALKSVKKQSGGSLVAVYDDRIVGSVSIRIQNIKGERTGFIDALAADRELRGKGIGRSLVDGAISWLEERKCVAIYATADRYNSPSWNIFIHRGFSVYEFPQQLKDYGLSFIRLWLSEFHFVGYGTFFLRRGKQDYKPREMGDAWHFLAAWLGIFFVWVIALRVGQSLVILPLLFGLVGLSLLAPELSQKLAARILGLEMTFKAWGSGLFFSSILATLGSFFPAYGSTYVKQLDWWYESKKREMGIISIVGPSISLLLAFVFWALSTIQTGGMFQTLLRIGYTMNLVNVIFNLIPIQAAGGLVWDGKKILAWNKTVWLILITVTAVLIIIDTIF